MRCGSRMFEIALCCLLVIVVPVVGKSDDEKSTGSVRIQGTISSPWDSEIQLVRRDAVHFHGKPIPATSSAGNSGDSIPMPRSEVTFSSSKITKTVVVDKEGFYQLDLPVGLYKMVAEGPSIGVQSLEPYERFFRVSSPAKIVLNGSLLVAPTSCDTASGGLPIERLIEMRKDDCGGVDFFPIPAKDGSPFQLYIRYPERRPNLNGHIYGNDRTATPGIRVVVAYNLFSLEANLVDYKTTTQTILATGDVMIEDGSGASRRATSASFRLQDGEAIPLN
jgi:hypothetical protein